MTQTILITGAGQGLGRALANEYAQQSVNLVLLDQDRPALNSLYDEIVKQKATPALYPLDLATASPDDYMALKNTLIKEYGQLDVVILNAAYLPGFTPVEHFDIEQWYQIIQINLNANFHLIQDCQPLLKTANNGKLVVISDADIKSNPAYYGAYGAAKSGLAQLIKTVARENINTPLSHYLAELPPFQSNTRSRQFPSENPNTLPSAQKIAQQLISDINSDDSRFLVRS